MSSIICVVYSEVGARVHVKTWRTVAQDELSLGLGKTLTLFHGTFWVMDNRTRTQGTPNRDSPAGPIVTPGSPWGPHDRRAPRFPRLRQRTGPRTEVHGSGARGGSPGKDWDEVRCKTVDAWSVDDSWVFLYRWGRIRNVCDSSRHHPCSESGDWWLPGQDPYRCERKAWPRTPLGTVGRVGGGVPGLECLSPHRVREARQQFKWRAVESQDQGSGSMTLDTPKVDISGGTPATR